MPKQLIFLTGKKRAGKDEIARYLTNKYNFKRLAFADHPKEIVEFCIKALNPNIDYKYYTELEKSKKVPKLNKSYRELVRGVGETFKDIFTPNIWVETVKQQFDRYDKIVVSDLRFEVELNDILSLNPTIWKIENNRLIEDNDSHLSEKGIDNKYVTHIIQNNGTFEELYEQIDNLIIK
jgi:hypothetical protein